MNYEPSNYRGRRPSMPLLMRLVPIGLALIGIAFYAAKGCQEGPFGRVQVVGMNPQEEAALGLQAFQEVLADSKVVPQNNDVKAVKLVAQRLIAATKNPDFLEATKTKEVEFDWEVEVVQDDQINAFCLPGGKIVVYTGILPVAENSAGLATVMGHEIAHALAHHGAERMAQQKMVQMGLGGASGSLGDMDPGQRQMVLQALNAGAKFGILSYSRKHESEADHMGVLLMAAAGYNPEESIHFWERMAEATKDGARPPEFASTHPSHETRISDLTQWLPEAGPIYQKNAKSTPRGKNAD